MEENRRNPEEQNEKKEGLSGGPLALALAGAALVGGGIVAAGGWVKGKVKARKARKEAEAAEKPENTDDKNDKKKK